MAIPAAPVPSPSDRMERIPILTRSHRAWLPVLALLLVFEMADLNTFAYAAPAIRREWGLSVEQIGFITASSYLGMFIGSILGGRLADRYGRKRVIVGATFFYSACSLASAFAVGVVDLAIYRILTGVGLMAMTAVMLTYVSEMYPRRLRGRVQALLLVVGLLGIPAMAGFARWVVPHGPSAWRWVFVLGAAGVVVALVASKVLPESVRWASANGRSTASSALVDRMEEQARAATGDELPPIEPQPTPAPASPRELLRPPFRKRLLVLSGFLMLAISVFYGFNAWIPTLLVENGLTIEQSLTFSTIAAFGAAPGALLSMFFIDRVERRMAIMVTLLIVAVMLIVFAFINSFGVLVVSGFLVVMVMQAMVACTYTYMPEIFSTRVRALGVGIGNGAGRLATFGSTFLIGAIASAVGGNAVFIYLGVAAVAAALLIGVFGERTRNRSLESISEDTVGTPAGIDPSATVTASRPEGSTR